MPAAGTFTHEIMIRSTTAGERLSWHIKLAVCQHYRETRFQQDCVNFSEALNTSERCDRRRRKKHTLTNEGFHLSSSIEVWRQGVHADNLFAG